MPHAKGECEKQIASFQEPQQLSFSGPLTPNQDLQPSTAAVMRLGWPLSINLGYQDLDDEPTG